MNAQAGVSEGDKIETLTTLDGKTFTGVTISKISKENIRIIHASGVATVPVQQLNKDLLASFGLSIAEAEGTAAARKQNEKNQEQLREERARTLSKSRIINGRIFQVIPDDKAVLIMISDEGYVISCKKDVEERMKRIAPIANGRRMGWLAAVEHESIQRRLKIIPVTYNWETPSEALAWIDVKTTEGLVDNTKISEGIFESTVWEKDLWIVEETGTTTYETNEGVRTVRRFKKKSEL
jgi:hypothetical protein